MYKPAEFVPRRLRRRWRGPIGMVAKSGSHGSSSGEPPSRGTAASRFQLFNRQAAPDIVPPFLRALDVGEAQSSQTRALSQPGIDAAAEAVP